MVYSLLFDLDYHRLIDADYWRNPREVFNYWERPSRPGLETRMNQLKITPDTQYLMTGLMNAESNGTVSLDLDILAMREVGTNEAIVYGITVEITPKGGKSWTAAEELIKWMDPKDILDWAFTYNRLDNRLTLIFNSAIFNNAFLIGINAQYRNNSRSALHNSPSKIGRNRYFLKEVFFPNLYSQLFEDDPPINPTPSNPFPKTFPNRIYNP